VLKHQWAARGEPGAILLGASKTVIVQLQFRPEFHDPTALMDVRIPRALAHAIDKQAIVDTVLDGEPGMAETLVSKEEEYYPELDRALTKYPLDLRRSDQLLPEMGFRRDGERLFGHSGARLSAEMIVAGGGSGYPREALILADGWKRAGTETPNRTLSAAEQLDMANRLDLSGLAHRPVPGRSLINPFTRLNIASMAMAARRWSGPTRAAGRIRSSNGCPTPTWCRWTGASATAGSIRG